jgi:ATP-dependent protease Clp ATPase subunit
MVETIYREAEAEHVLCAFCGKSSAEVATLIAGPDRYTYICDECIATCSRILEERKKT